MSSMFFNPFEQLRGKKNSVSFDFETLETVMLGKIKRPMVTVKFWSDVYNQWQKTTMLIDTGADYTLLPRYMGTWFTAEKNDHNQNVTLGLGGAQKVHFLDQVKVKVGSFERSIPVGIATTSKIPPLMGRHLFFETFDVQFNYTNKVIFSDKRD